GGNVYVEERTVDVHIRRLRKALGSPYDGLVQTVRGTGYRFSTKVLFSSRAGSPGKRNAQVKTNWLISITGGLLSVLGPCLIAGLILGQPAWALVTGLALYLAYTLWQARRLQSWLNESSGEPPPERSEEH